MEINFPGGIYAWSDVAVVFEADKVEVEYHLKVTEKDCQKHLFPLV